MRCIAGLFSTYLSVRFGHNGSVLLNLRVSVLLSMDGIDV